MLGRIVRLFSLEGRLGRIGYAVTLAIAAGLEGAAVAIGETFRTPDGELAGRFVLLGMICMCSAFLLILPATSRRLNDMGLDGHLTFAGVTVFTVLLTPRTSAPQPYYDIAYCGLLLAAFGFLVFKPSHQPTDLQALEPSPPPPGEVDEGP